MQEQIQAGSIGSKSGGSRQEFGTRESVGSARAAKATAFFLAGVSNVAKRDTAKQDCTKVGATDDDIPISDAPTHHAESVWDTGKVDVDGGWQVKKNPQKVSPAWCLCGLDGVQGFARAKGTELLPHARPRTAAGFRHHIGEEESPESQDRTCLVCGVDDEKFTRPKVEFCEADARETSGVCRARVPRLETASGQRLMEVTCEKLATKERTEVL